MDAKTALPDSMLNRLSKSSKNAVVLVDGVNTLGDIAPLKEISHLIDHYEALLVVDDSHATGVLGPNGRGTPEHCGVSSSRIFQTESFGKAFASSGGSTVVTLILTEAVSVIPFESLTVTDTLWGPTS